MSPPCVRRAASSEILTNPETLRNVAHRRGHPNGGPGSRSGAAARRDLITAPASADRPSHLHQEARDEHALRSRWRARSAGAAAVAGVPAESDAGSARRPAALRPLRAAAAVVRSVRSAGVRSSAPGLRLRPAGPAAARLRLRPAASPAAARLRLRPAAGAADLRRSRLLGAGVRPAGRRTASSRPPVTGSRRATRRPRSSPTSSRGTRHPHSPISSPTAPRVTRHRRRPRRPRRAERAR